MLTCRTNLPAHTWVVSRAIILPDVFLGLLREFSKGTIP